MPASLPETMKHRSRVAGIVAGVVERWPGDDFSLLLFNVGALKPPLIDET